MFRADVNIFMTSVHHSSLVGMTSAYLHTNDVLIFYDVSVTNDVIICYDVGVKIKSRVICYDVILMT